MKDKKKLAALLPLMAYAIGGSFMGGYSGGKPKWMSKDRPCKNCGKMREDPIGQYCNRKCRDEFVNKTTGMS
jgi:hypothetical protein